MLSKSCEMLSHLSEWDILMCILIAKRYMYAVAPLVILDTLPLYLVMFLTELWWDLPRAFVFFCLLWLMAFFDSASQHVRTIRGAPENLAQYVDKHHGKELSGKTPGSLEKTFFLWYALACVQSGVLLVFIPFSLSYVVHAIV